MTQPLAPPMPRSIHADPRDLARRVVALTAVTAGLAGILAGNPLLAVLARCGIVCGAGILAITATESIVRRAKRRVVR
jgi:hypothetical protein